MEPEAGSIPRVPKKFLINYTQFQMDLQQIYTDSPPDSQ